MPKYKNVIAGLAISTALTGGAVALGAATTTTTASATTVSSWGGGGCGGGGFWRSGHRRCGGGGCHRGWSRGCHNRFRSTWRNNEHRQLNNINVRNSDADVVVG
ncbi:hypothetical protein Psi02_18240 [Planotetraspora silvatica]|uniref:Uncharacterized protein n=1 Tax=Planotetraspora silvatica TaxID=234614 RepID=A0A8J3UJ10_9ACTN|nr:hypothetical protein [Planotetraspora silvatica]GII45400.1 hypothetical protein Psi02_18240 [Planotetraspora silvatica]